MVETMHGNLRDTIMQEVENKELKEDTSFKKDVFFERMNNLKLSDDISEIIWCSINQ